MPEHGRNFPDKANHPSRQVGRQFQQGGYQFTVQARPPLARQPKNHEDYAQESHERHYNDYMADIEEPYPEAHHEAHTYAEGKVREEIDWDRGPGRWDTDPRV